MSNSLTKGDIVYYARIMPNLGIFDVYDIKIRTITDTWFSGVEKRDKRVFLFPYSAIDEYVFLNRKDAVDVATNAEENNKKVISTETYYEEYEGRGYTIARYVEWWSYNPTMF